MNRNFSYSLPTNLIIGPETEERFFSQLHQKAYEKTLLITGRESYQKNPFCLQVIERIPVKQHLKLPSQPLYQDFSDLNGFDSIIAIGGGSILDAAKALAVGKNRINTLLGNVTNPLQDDAPIPVVAIPTTFATGSEGNGTFTLNQKDAKHTFFQLSARPEMAWCHPEMVRGNTLHQYKEAIFDLISHLLEQFFSDSDLGFWTHGAIIQMVIDLVETVQDFTRLFDDPHAIAKVQYYAYLAMSHLFGQGHRVGWGLHHLADRIEKKFQFSHAQALATCFPIWEKMLLENQTQKLAYLKDRLGKHYDYVLTLQKSLSCKKTTYETLIQLPEIRF